MNRIAAALVLLLLSCAPKRMVVINGQTVSYEEAAGEEFRKAKSQFDQGHFDEAAEAFRRFLHKYPESELSDEALFRCGQALARGGKLEEAQTMLETLLQQRPGPPCPRARRQAGGGADDAADPPRAAARLAVQESRRGGVGAGAVQAGHQVGRVAAAHGRRDERQGAGAGARRALGGVHQERAGRRRRSLGGERRRGG